MSTERPEFNETPPLDKSLLPKISPELIHSLAKTIESNEEILAEYARVLKQENPELMEYIIDFSDGAEEEIAGAGETTVKAMLLLCKVIDSQLEADQMSKQFGN